MKKIEIEKKGVITNGPVIGEDDKVLAWLQDCLNRNVFGLPERWVSVDQLREGDLALDMEIREIMPQHERTALEDVVDEATGEVLHRKGDVIVVPAVTKEFHKLPSEFVVIIEDVVPDYRVLRAAEYVKIDEMKNEAMVELLAEGRSEKMEEYKALRAAIKLKIPRS